MQRNMNNAWKNVSLSPFYCRVHWPLVGCKEQVDLIGHLNSMLTWLANGHCMAGWVLKQVAMKWVDLINYKVGKSR